MQRSVKYGGYALGTGAGGWVLANAMPHPPTSWLVTASVFAVVTFGWSIYWTIRDLIDWWTGRKDGDLKAPPFVLIWRLVRDDTFPVRRLIPFHRAAILAYPKLRDLTAVKLIFKMRSFAPEKVPAIIAQLLLDEAVGFDFPVYGMLVPSEHFERIPEDDLKSLRISDDATFMYDAFAGGYDKAAIKPKYVCLAMKKNDLKRRIKEIREKHAGR
jgi:hypothetical protein